MRCLVLLFTAAALMGQPAVNPRVRAWEPSPANIIRMVDGVRESGRHDLTPVWRRLGMQGKGREPEVSDFTSMGGAVAAQIPTRLPGWENRVLVEVCAQERHYCVFLLLAREGGVWRMADHFESYLLKYTPVELSVLEEQGKQWTVVHESGSGGTGVAGFVDSWYELHSGKVRKVLTVDRSGNQLNTNPEREWDVKFLPKHPSNSANHLVFEWNVTFKAHDEAESLLWRTTREAHYTRAPGTVEFRLDPSLSGWNQATIDNLTNWDEDYYAQEFPEVEFGQLSRIAANPNDPRFAWLQGYLKGAPQTPKTRMLREAAAQSAR